MKKLLVIALVSGMVLPAFAEDKLDGCGLGWQVTSKKSYTATTTRGTTNFIIPPTFGMTTGTLGCDRLDIGAKDKEAANYVATNFESLKTELAVGQGEYVTALATSMGCSAKANELGAQVQKNYNTVVAPATSAVELYKGIKAQAAQVCI